jgi:hypothetical protein
VAVDDLKESRQQNKGGLTGRNSDRAAIAGNGYALTNTETGRSLFLHHHNGVAIILPNFQFNALGAIHGAADALARNAAGYRSGRG